ncbi:Polyubiquitin-A Ubiquitin [Triplophysa tibetana]|uniref:Polyubiquitin-A Ubiquitin n=1 Tax=Triplophysa tibetana TaxID=1572043 RepID=A0A5A9P6B7_9TELE|nr:Polyubiquitin-A Ubiquitin [Triplophysa tibetana]
MDLIIKGINGNTKRLPVDCNATVGHLKLLISQHFGVDPVQQRLSANNGLRIDLDENSRSLSSYGLHSESVVAFIVTIPGPMQVLVINEKGITSTYDVDPKETVNQLQQKIFNKERVPVDQQRLISNGRQLESGRMLKDYDITNQSTIHMTLRLRLMMELTVTELNGNSQRLTVDSNATVGELKLLISQHFNVNPSQQKLSVNNGQRIILDNDFKSLSDCYVTSGSTIALFRNTGPMQVLVINEKGIPSTYDVDPSETVNQLQQKIFNKERVPVDQQRLVVNGRQLASGKMLQDYNITHLSTIHMTLRLRTAMDLIIKGINGNTKRLRVDCNATVGHLKLLISQHFGVDPVQQRLSANNGLRINLDDDSRSLSSYGLHSESVVAFIVTIPGPMQVFVRNEKGITSTYDVDPKETVNQLQQKIFNKERVPVDQQRLISNGRQLESGRMLKDYDITNQSTIHMTLRLRENPGPAQVFVKNEKGITSTYEVDPSETVNQLQQKIFNKERVPVDQQRLINNGRQLESGMMLQDYDIKGTIHMTLRLRGAIQVFVKNEDGQTGTYEVYPDETVDQLQAKIYNKERVPVDQQKLIYNCKQLMPGKKLKEYDIKPKSTIFMTLRLRSG